MDRLWPRGVSKEAAALKGWAKELAPTTELREWFGHDPALWPEFQKKYKAELKKNEAVEAFPEDNALSGGSFRVPDNAKPVVLKIYGNDILQEKCIPGDSVDTCFPV